MSKTYKQFVTEGKQLQRGNTVHVTSKKNNIKGKAGVILDVKNGKYKVKFVTGKSGMFDASELTKIEAAD